MSLCHAVVFGFLWYIPTNCWNQCISVVGSFPKSRALQWSGPWVTITPTQTIHLIQGKWLILPRYFHHSCHQYHRYSCSYHHHHHQPQDAMAEFFGFFDSKWGTNILILKHHQEKITMVKLLNLLALHPPKKTWIKIPSSPICPLSNKQNCPKLQTSCMPWSQPSSSLPHCLLLPLSPQGTDNALSLQPPPPNWMKKSFSFEDGAPNTNRILTSLKQKKSNPWGEICPPKKRKCKLNQCIKCVTRV